MTLNSGRYRRACNQRPIVIERDPLVCDGDDDLERALQRVLLRQFSLRCVLWFSLLRQFRLSVPVLTLVPERNEIVVLWSVLGPERAEIVVLRSLLVHELNRDYRALAGA